MWYLKVNSTILDKWKDNNWTVKWEFNHSDNSPRDGAILFYSCSLCKCFDLCFCDMTEWHRWIFHHPWTLVADVIRSSVSALHIWGRSGPKPSPSSRRCHYPSVSSRHFSVPTTLSINRQSRENLPLPPPPPPRPGQQGLHVTHLWFSLWQQQSALTHQERHCSISRSMCTAALKAVILWQCEAETGP